SSRTSSSIRPDFGVPQIRVFEDTPRAIRFGGAREGPVRRRYQRLSQICAATGAVVGRCEPRSRLLDADAVRRRYGRRKLAYLQQPERHRHVDPELFDILEHAASALERRRLATIEDSGTIPGASYHNDLLPDELAARHT